MSVLCIILSSDVAQCLEHGGCSTDVCRKYERVCHTVCSLHLLICCVICCPSLISLSSFEILISGSISVFLHLPQCSTSNMRSRNVID